MWVAANMEDSSATFRMHIGFFTLPTLKKSQGGLLSNCSPRGLIEVLPKKASGSFMADELLHQQPKKAVSVT